MIRERYAFIGSDPSTYAFFRVTSQRNSYRIRCRKRGYVRRLSRVTLYNPGNGGYKPPRRIQSGPTTNVQTCPTTNVQACPTRRALIPRRAKPVPPQHNRQSNKAAPPAGNSKINAAGILQSAAEVFRWEVLREPVSRDSGDQHADPAIQF